MADGGARRPAPREPGRGRAAAPRHRARRARRAVDAARPRRRRRRRGPRRADAGAPARLRPARRRHPEPGAARRRGARARGVLADLERDPDLVLVHAPFVLARLSAPPPREEPAAPLSPEKRCHSSDALSSLSGSSRSAPGRRGAPGAGVHGLSMDGTFSGHAGIFLEDLDGSPSARPVEVA